MILRVFCLQNTVAPIKYCIPSFWKFVKTPYTTIPLFKTQLSSLCLKRNDKFCAVHAKEMEEARDSAPPECKTFTTEPTCTPALRKCLWNGDKCEELWTQEKLETTCHPCTLVYTYRALFVLKLMDEFRLPDPNNERPLAKLVLSGMSYIVNGICSTDLKDAYCMPKLQTKPTDLSCTGMTNYLSTAGCCAPSVLEFAQGLCSLEKLLAPASACQTEIDAVTTQINSCVTLGKTCAQIKYELIHEALVTGIASEWVTANKDRLIAELKKSLPSLSELTLLLSKS